LRPSSLPSTPKRDLPITVAEVEKASEPVELIEHMKAKNEAHGATIR